MTADLVRKLHVDGIEELVRVVDPPNTRRISNPPAPRRIFDFLTKWLMHWAEI